jgi:hypothetical protein
MDPFTQWHQQAAGLEGKLRVAAPRREALWNSAAAAMLDDSGNWRRSRD